MKVREIAAAIEAFAPLGTQESWDNAGLCIGSPDAEAPSWSASTARPRWCAKRWSAAPI